jgi:hypothetical protein
MQQQARIPRKSEFTQVSSTCLYDFVPTIFVKQLVKRRRTQRKLAESKMAMTVETARTDGTGR